MKREEDQEVAELDVSNIITTEGTWVPLFVVIYLFVCV